MIATAAPQLTRLPVQPVVAARLVRFMAAGNGSAAELGRIVESDPALSARVIHLTSAPYYGLGRRVGSAARAVVLLGVSTVQGVAARAALDLVDGCVHDAPPGFFAHALATAAATGAVARRLGLAPADAFTLGLLHDVGLLTGPGEDHAGRGAEALAHWGFPPAFVRAVAGHHGPGDARDSLALALMAGEALAVALGPSSIDEPEGLDLPDALEAVGLHLRDAAGLLHEAERDLAARAELLEVAP